MFTYAYHARYSDQKQLMKSGHITIKSKLQHITEGLSREELKQLVTLLPDENRQKRMDLCYLLSSCFLLSHIAQDSLLREGAIPYGLCLPTSMNKQDNPSQTCPQAK